MEIKNIKNVFIINLIKLFIQLDLSSTKLEEANYLSKSCSVHIMYNYVAYVQKIYRWSFIKSSKSMNKIIP